jgi:hypothetical protein
VSPDLEAGTRTFAILILAMVPIQGTCYHLASCLKGLLYMKNVDMKLNGNNLTITVDFSKEFGMSSSVKSLIIASTEGNVSIPERDKIKIGLNIYRKP